ncbi:hypothetical protein V1514DRAFT_336998 [Lipomyces japonicus]|uniref:uncharacterized protein n=1 Tax=Lipomyces japonicus TaxID=56871 RepID=UPI0034CE43EA
MVEVSLTVGKLDASIAVLLTADHHLIEFPSILLPSDVQAGSIVKISCEENFNAESTDKSSFAKLQDEIFEIYGKRSPLRPQLRLRNATQTSIVLEWDPVDLATAQLRSLSLFRNNTRLGKIPNAMTNTSTKLSGLSVDTAYTFHLELATSAGTYVSDKLTVKTHKMTDLSGITVCAGIISDQDHAILDETIARIGAKPLQDRVRIDTTHFICVDGRGAQWERALEANIPIVTPEWLRACESEGRIVGVRSYYLNADPKSRPPIRDHRPPQQTRPPPPPLPDVKQVVQQLTPVSPEPVAEQHDATEQVAATMIPIASPSSPSLQDLQPSPPTTESPDLPSAAPQTRDSATNDGDIAEAALTVENASVDDTTELQLESTDTTTDNDDFVDAGGDDNDDDKGFDNVQL